jgi:protein disulfide-isomerase-like protein
MSYPNYSHFSILGYATHHNDSSSHSYRVVNPIAQRKENYNSFSGARLSSPTIKYFEDTPSTFESYLRSYPKAFVWFFATWCGHCIHMEKDYEKAAEALSDRIAFVKVDADKNQALCEKYNVSGFPTLKLFINGREDKTYEGPRNAKAFIKWLDQNA